ncbi:helix-turn-helix- domain containing protein AraC type [Kineococcus radiotolerans SRS30216 = ATCC BAA-149]|uniref:Helix-turn-helix-domain containing protein AraC type n=1 Tax=Kineococcus radiotolerans (strain ATCC BAA-149 / DSM 14245 / SRS30216) TaxID=266940 RepID=A6WAP5_KINRD|nr:AraC family transcriptional regulator [Kineococcus radiotolerans]ABS03884.1 helix-turn-helix- domain containing protein AraC type [Kineococcus radiotolerans SRS30216 = ATCC BAA-149]
MRGYGGEPWTPSRTCSPAPVPAGRSCCAATWTPPWALRVHDRAPLTVLAVVTGSAWVLRHGTAPQRIVSGDVAVVRGPDPYVVADDPDTPPQALIDVDQRCTTLDGVGVPLGWRGAGVWGNRDGDGGTQLLTGTYTEHGALNRRLLDALPALVVLRADAATAPVLTWLTQEVTHHAPGQEAVLDRLLDLLLVTALRAWFDTSRATAPGWYTAAADPVVGPALRLLQDHPEHPWTIGSLAAAAATSRATLARRFTALLGRPPMGYLTTWRLDLAADLLLEPGTTLTAVARRVGYGSPYALSAAFTRQFGISPTQHRDAGTRGAGHEALSGTTTHHAHVSTGRR